MRGPQRESKRLMMLGGGAKLFRFRPLKCSLSRMRAGACLCVRAPTRAVKTGPLLRVNLANNSLHHHHHRRQPPVVWLREVVWETRSARVSKSWPTGHGAHLSAFISSIIYNWPALELAQTELVSLFAFPLARRQVCLPRKQVHAAPLGRRKWRAN